MSEAIQPVSNNNTNAAKPPINWLAAVVLMSTPILALVFVPLYAWYYDYSMAAWISFVLLAGMNGMAITAGYHRLWSHRAYEAHWIVRVVLMLFGTMATQNSI